MTTHQDNTRAESLSERVETVDEVADFIRDQVCCPRIHGCELGGAEECPAERVRALSRPAPTGEGIERAPASPSADPHADRWVMVPREPTAAMLEASWRQAGESSEMRCRYELRAARHYRAMIVAAPSPPAHDDGGYVSGSESKVAQAGWQEGSPNRVDLENERRALTQPEGSGRDIGVVVCSASPPTSPDHPDTSSAASEGE